MRGREQLLDNGSSSPMDCLRSAQQSMGIIVFLLRGRWKFRCDAGKVGAREKATTGRGVLLSENVGNSGSGKICICLLEGCVYLFILL
jgi:hypothetical protein